MYIIKRIDQDGGYVTKDGAENSYTHNILKAKIFRTLKEAEQNRCPDNEIILKLNA